MSDLTGLTPPDVAAKQAQRRADASRADASLASRAGAAAEQVDARRRVAREFIALHLVPRSPADCDRIVDGIDCSQPVEVIDGRDRVTLPTAPVRLDLLLSQRVLSTRPDDPVYALRFTPQGPVAAGDSRSKLTTLPARESRS